MALAIISLVILFFSVVLHEVAHGYMADMLGDPTARMQGRLTLNPLKHIDPVGTIIVPIITSMAGFTFGWAKPVPYNPYNLRNKRVGELLIALAGPFTNLLLALIFSIVIRVDTNLIADSPHILEVTSYIVLINIMLAVFNLIPLPPLDGSKILFFLLPRQYGRIRFALERYAPLFILLVVIFLWKLVTPIVPLLFQLFTGIPLM